MSHIQTHDLTHFEVVTNDVDGTRTFYEKMYGWKFQVFGPEHGNYVMGTLPNGTTCGLRAPQNEGDQPGVHNYVLVRDVNQAVEDAKRLGAQVVLGPMEIPGMGWLAVFLVHGVPNAVWQSAQK